MQCYKFVSILLFYSIFENISSSSEKHWYVPPHLAWTPSRDDIMSNANARFCLIPSNNQRRKRERKKVKISNLKPN